MTAQTSYQKAFYHYQQGHYDSAFLYKNVLDTTKNKSLQLWKNIIFAHRQFHNPLQIEFLDIGDAINTEHLEYLPSFTQNNDELYFTRRVEKPFNIEQFYYSKKIKGQWQKAILLDYPFNVQKRQGGISISSNGLQAQFAAEDSHSFGLYYSIKNKDNIWQESIKFSEPINTYSWESQPTLSSNGKVLIFSSNRKGGFGGRDLYITKLLNDNTWSIPKNLGASINTDGDEQCPFLHYDNTTLYFSSDGRIGMGKSDIYKTTFLADSFLEPINLGYPLNTNANDNGFIVDAFENTAFFSSNKNGQLDIFSCYFGNNVPQNIRPQNISSKRDTLVTPTILDTTIKKIVQGQKIILENVLFDINSADLLPESLQKLSIFVKLLQQNPSKNINIEGHTDNSGTEKFNLQLSIERAKSVYDYLISQNINQQRLSFVGFGDTQPIFENNTEENRRKNRRVIFVVLN